MATNEELTGLVARTIALLESLRWRPGDFDPEARLLRDCLAAIGGPGNRGPQQNLWVPAGQWGFEVGDRQ